MHIGEEHLKNMEFILEHAAQGTHILFENGALAEVLREPKDEKEFFDSQTMLRVQELMTSLLMKKTYLDKMAYLSSLDKETYEILVRSYIHMVEHAAYQATSVRH